MTEHFKKFFSLGFFPEELPPEFGPYGITDEVAEDLWDKIDELRPLNGTPSKPISISFPKSEYIRRDFHFLNPLYFARLSYTILSNWEKITTHTEQSKFSTSRLILSESKNQIFKQDPFARSIDQQIKRSAAKEYVLYLDIENYYPSIYTHTIDWALNSGRRRHYLEEKKRKYLGVALDIDVRRSQGNLTNGIVIGPVTSRIISEIITSHFDQIIESKFNDITGIRFVDDYHLFLSSREEIESVQTVLQKVLAGFKLKFNEAKISIDTLPEIYSDYWTSFFDNKQQLIKGEIADKKEVVRRFSKAFELIKNDPKNPSLRYFFRVLEDKEIIKLLDLSQLLELVHHSLKIDPRSISRACIALLEGELINVEIHDELEHFEPTLIKCSNLGYSFEVLWMLFLFLHAGRAIPEKAIDNIISNCNIVCVAYLFKCWEHNLVSNDRIDHIKRLLRVKVREYENIWRSPLWLVVYEDKRQGWEIFNDVEVPEDFQILLNHDIQFLKDELSNDPDDIRISRYERKEDDDELPF